MSPPSVTYNHHTSNVEVDDVVNEYEALRRAKIARNEARLRELGLLGPTPPPPPRTTTISAATTQNMASSKSVVRSSSSSSPPPRMPTRRSKRLREGTTATTTITTVATPVVAKTRRKGGTTNSRIPNNMAVTPSPPLTKPKTLTPPPPPPNSARAMRLNVPVLLQHCLGQALAHTGKAHVMEYAARVALLVSSSSSSSVGHTISFNKYSGVQEWDNCIFLWINRGAPQSDAVVNEFSKDTRCVTWFGGSRLHNHSPVVQKLCQTSSSSTSSFTSDTLSTTDGTKQENKDMSTINTIAPHEGGWPVVLWSRTYQPNQKTFGPYTCLGRLHYVSHDPQSHPLAFVFKLIDYDNLPQSVQIDLHKVY
jgi:hypothetical protein